MIAGGVFFFMRDSFIFYRSFYEALKDLSIKDRAILFEAICEYSLNSNQINLEKTPKTVFKLIQPILEANNKKYENGRKGAEFGKLGGRPAKKETPPKPQENPTETPNKDKDNNKDDNVYVYGKKSDLSFAVKAKYLSDFPCKVYESGLDEYIEIHQMGMAFRKPYMKDLFWKEWNGKIFNDHQHVNSVILNINNNKNG